MHSSSGLSHRRAQGSGGRSCLRVEPDVPVGLVWSGRGVRRKRDEDIALHLGAVADERRGRRSGFTLLEILLTLALIGLLAAVLIGGGAQLLDKKATAPDDIFWNAVQEARKLALKSDSQVTLRFVDDKDKGQGFAVTSGDTTKMFPVPPSRDLEITFLAQEKGGNLIMVGGTALETKALPEVTFYPDGTCTAFKVQFFQHGATHMISVDPWTCAPVLTPADSNGSNSGSPS